MKFKANPRDAGYDCFRCFKDPDIDDLLRYNIGGCWNDVFGKDWLCTKCAGHCLKAYDHRYNCGQTIPVVHTDGARGQLYALITQYDVLVNWLNHSKKPHLTHINNIRLVNND